MGCNAWNHRPGCNCGWGGDTGGGGRKGGGTAGTSLPSDRKIDGLATWGPNASKSIKSYVNPNAYCPVCGAVVYFYQSEAGGRVFFDDLGWPWPKHPCTDTSSKSSGGLPATLSGSKPRRNHGLRPQNFSAYGVPPSKHAGRDEAKAYLRFLASGWHPLLQVKISELKDGWRQVIGIDGVTQQRCSMITKGAFQDWAPTFIRVEQPQRVICELDQAIVSGDSVFHAERAKGWFGAYGLDEARIAKRAQAGDVKAMYDCGELRSFRFLKPDEALPHAERWVDLPAARYWFNRASEAGSDAGFLAGAYLEDLIIMGEKAYPLNDKRDFLSAIIEAAADLETEVKKLLKQADKDFLAWDLEWALDWFKGSFEDWAENPRVENLGRAAKELHQRWHSKLEKYL